MKSKVMKWGLILGSIMLFSGIFLDLGRWIVNWNFYRAGLFVSVIGGYGALMIHTYRSGEWRKWREQVLVLIIAFMISVLAYFLA